MDLQELVHEWISKWEEGDYQNIPVEEHFVHSSPFGNIYGKENYLKLVQANEDLFLGGKFEILDEIYDDDKASIRYLMNKGGHKMEVTEWFYAGQLGIAQIVSYYHVGADLSYEDSFNLPDDFKNSPI